MVRTTFALPVVVLVVAAAGCRMCASPYDYCSPTFTGECAQGCLPNAREGSILSHGIQPALDPEMMVPVPAEVISETDELVMETDEVVSASEKVVESKPADEQSDDWARPIQPPHATARSWRPVQR